MARPPQMPVLDYDEEGRHVVEEFDRREAVVPDSLYARYNESFLFMTQSRERASTAMLKAADVFPTPGTPCLEIGYGRLGALGMMVSWGLRESDLHGIELDARRASVAQAALPGADLRVGDARSMPWADGAFGLVVAWTVFTSILSEPARHSLAREIVRVLKPGGALLFYDFAWNNPRNRRVRAVTRRELRTLFPALRGEVRSNTLAPPLSRLLAPRSWLLATAFESIPLLRSHLLAVLLKD